MIIRVVKMKFKVDKIQDFLAFSDRIKPIIKSQQGCLNLEIFQDNKENSVFFTISNWESEDDLNAYRNSDFFKDVWPKAKKWFSQKPEAWSLINTAKVN